MNIWPVINLFVGVCITSLGIFQLMIGNYVWAGIDLVVGFINFTVVFLILKGGER